MLQAELKILGGKHQGKAIPLSTKKFLVGREQDCHLRPNSDLVSRHHCVFSIDDYAVRLRDLGSTNGTRVNGKPLHGEVILKAGDQIGIGKLELELVIRQRSGSAAPEPVPVPLGLSDMEIMASTGTVEIPARLPDGNPGETSFELPTNLGVPTAETSTTLSADTAIIPGSTPGIPAQFPGYPAMPAQGYPAPGFGGAPGYPGYPQPMGYPQQPMAYPGQYPGYAPQAYPGMPGYPMQQQQMPYGGYGAPAQSQAPAAAAADTIAVKLPPPDQTGVKAPAPAPASPDGAAAAPKVEEKPSNTAADIIKSYMQRRTHS